MSGSVEVSGCRAVGVSTMSMSVLCYASAVLVALLNITLLGKHQLPTSPACNTLACQLCILHSLPPLQAAWILAIGVACRFALQRRRCLGASIAAMLASLLATPIACEPDQCVFFIPCQLCKQCELWGMALLAGLHCSVGVVWVGLGLASIVARLASWLKHSLC